MITDWFTANGITFFPLIIAGFIPRRWLGTFYAVFWTFCCTCDFELDFLLASVPCNFSKTWFFLFSSGKKFLWLTGFTSVLGFGSTVLKAFDFPERTETAPGDRLLCRLPRRF